MEEDIEWFDDLLVDDDGTTMLVTVNSTTNEKKVYKNVRALVVELGDGKTLRPEQQKV